jgi:hypothetical protein
MTNLPTAAAYALAQDLKSVPPDERETVAAQAIALLAEQERREAEDELLVRHGFGEYVAPEDRARLQGEEGDESTE